MTTQDWIDEQLKGLDAKGKFRFFKSQLIECEDTLYLMQKGEIEADAGQIGAQQDLINFYAYKFAELQEEEFDTKVHWKRITREYETGKAYMVEYFYGKHPSSLVDVRAPHEKFGSLSPAEINWKATGAQSVEFTQEFLSMMKDAIHDAERMNKDRFE